MISKISISFQIAIIFVLFQSCISSKISKENKIEDQVVVVKTHDGFTYYLPWYEVKGGKLVATLNTRRIVMDEHQIIEVAIYSPEPANTDLHTALSHDGDISMIAYDEGQRVHHYKFYRIAENNGQIIGYTFTGGYAADIAIPLDNLNSIEVEKAQYMDDSYKYVLGWALIIALESAAIFFETPMVY